MYPAGQGKHSVEAKGAYVPASQLVHSVDASESKSAKPVNEHPPPIAARAYHKSAAITTQITNCGAHPVGRYGRMSQKYWRICHSRTNHRRWKHRSQCRQCPQCSLYTLCLRRVAVHLFGCQVRMIRQDIQGTGLTDRRQDQQILRRNRHSWS